MTKGIHSIPTVKSGMNLVKKDDFLRESLRQPLQINP